MKITNRKAHRDYQIMEKMEAGIVLTGAEIKSLRGGRANLDQAQVRIRNQEAWVVNFYIHPYQAGQEKFAVTTERRDRKLLLHRPQIHSLIGKLKGQNLTLVPLSCYIARNVAKLEIAVARGKRKYEKREAIKNKDIERETEREMRGKI